MLTDDLRNRLIEQMKSNPQEAIKELEQDPRILELLLRSDQEVKKTQQELNNERIKYVNMTSQMQTQLKQKADQLNTTQGLLIGAGVLLLLALLDEK